MDRELDREFNTSVMYAVLFGLTLLGIPVCFVGFGIGKQLGLNPTANGKFGLCIFATYVFIVWLIGIIIFTVRHIQYVKEEAEL